MDAGWSAAIPAAVTAISTLIIRYSAKREKDEIKKDTSSPWDVKAVERKVDELREEFDTLKASWFKANPGLDHRGPKKE